MARQINQRRSVLGSGPLAAFPSLQRGRLRLCAQDRLAQQMSELTVHGDDGRLHLFRDGFRVVEVEFEPGFRVMRRDGGFSVGGPASLVVSSREPRDFERVHARLGAGEKVESRDGGFWQRYDLPYLIARWDDRHKPQLPA